MPRWRVTRGTAVGVVVGSGVEVGGTGVSVGWREGIIVEVGVIVVGRQADKKRSIRIEKRGIDDRINSDYKLKE